MAASGSDQATSAPPPSSGDRTCGLDMTYVKSIHGILKAKQIGWSVIAFILICLALLGVANIFFFIATLCGWTSTLVIWFMFATHMDKKVTKINWYLADLAVCALATILYTVIGIPVLISINPVAIAAGVFGLIAVASYAVGGWYSFKRWRESKRRQTSDNQYDVPY